MKQFFFIAMVALKSEVASCVKLPMESHLIIGNLRVDDNSGIHFSP